MKECDLDFDLKDVALDQKVCTSKKTVDLKNTPRDLKSKNVAQSFENSQFWS